MGENMLMCRHLNALGCPEHTSGTQVRLKTGVKNAYELLSLSAPKS